MGLQRVEHDVAAKQRHTSYQLPTHYASLYLSKSPPESLWKLLQVIYSFPSLSAHYICGQKCIPDMWTLTCHVGLLSVS